MKNFPVLPKPVLFNRKFLRTCFKNNSSSRQKALRVHFKQWKKNTKGKEQKRRNKHWYCLEEKANHTWPRLKLQLHMLFWTALHLMPWSLLPGTNNSSALSLLCSCHDGHLTPPVSCPTVTLPVLWSISSHCCHHHQNSSTRTSHYNHCTGLSITQQIPTCSSMSASTSPLDLESQNLQQNLCCPFH